MSLLLLLLLASQPILPSLGSLSQPEPTGAMALHRPLHVQVHLHAPQGVPNHHEHDLGQLLRTALTARPRKLSLSELP